MGICASARRDEMHTSVVDGQDGVVDWPGEALEAPMVRTGPVKGNLAHRRAWRRVVCTLIDPINAFRGYLMAGAQGDNASLVVPGSRPPAPKLSASTWRGGKGTSRWLCGAAHVVVAVQRSSSFAVSCHDFATRCSSTEAVAARNRATRRSARADVHARAAAPC